MVDLATLVVKLEAQTAQYQAQLQQATTQLKKFQDDTIGTIAELAKSFVELLVVEKLLDFTSAVIESEAQVYKFAQVLGVSTEAVSELQYAAKASGVDDFSTALQKFAKSSTSAAEGSAATANAFDEIGVSVKDATGNIKPADQLLLEVSQSLSQYQDGLAKTAVVQALFGRSGGQLIPFLNQGAAGIAALRDEAQKLGISLTGDTAKSAEEFEANLVSLKAALQGVFQGALSALLPLLVELGDELKSSATQGGGLHDVAIELGKDFAAVTAIVYTVYRTVADLGSAIKAVYNILTSPISQAGKIWDDYTVAAKKAEDQANAFLAKLEATGDEAKSVANGTEAISAAIDAVNTKPAIQIVDPAALKKLTDMSTALKDQAATFDQGTAAVLKYRLANGDLATDIAKAGQKGKDAAAQIIVYAQNLEALKNESALDKINAQLETLAGNTADAAAATFDLTNKQLKASLQDQGNAAGLSQLATLKQLTVVQAQFNDLQTAATRINADASLAQAVIQRKIADGDVTQLQGAKLLDDQRVITVAKLSDINAAAQKLSTQFGTQLPKLKDGADKLNGSLATLADNTGPKLADQNALANLNVQVLTLGGHLEDAAKAATDLSQQQQKASFQSNNNAAGLAALQNVKDLTVAQAAYNELLQKGQDVKTAELLQENQITRAVDAGTTTTLDGQQQIEAARAAEIVQLNAVFDSLQKISDQYGTSIPKLVTQTAQFKDGIADVVSKTNLLDKTLRDDLTNDASKAFSDFVTGTKSAHDALIEFVTDWEKQLVDLASKNLFESLFKTGSGGASSGFSSILGLVAGLFGGGGGAAAAGATTAGAGISIDDYLAATGGRAGGGPVSKGVAYDVGEHGLERFIPDANGTIVPNNQLKNGGDWTVHNTFVLPDSTASRQTQMQIAAAASRGIDTARRRNR